jgi:Uncharacterized protein conserved in bacteria
MKDVKLGKHFYLSEFCRSEWAARRGIVIEPPPHIVNNLRALVVNVLDPLRAEIGPIHVTSGYRPVVVNEGIGGSRTSQHVMGQAADIVSHRMPVRQVFDTIRRMQLPFDQVIEEFGHWTHVSYGPRRRGQALVARHLNGAARYTIA